MKSVLCVMWLLPAAVHIQGHIQHESQSSSTALANATINVICEFFAKRTSAVYFNGSEGMFRNIGVLRNVDCDIAFILSNAHLKTERVHSSYHAHSNVFIVRDYADFRLVHSISSID